MSKNIEIINHTADIGIKVYGKTIEELFINSLKGLYKIMGIKLDGTESIVEINIQEEEYENLIVKFLNEIIYYAETKKIAGEIEQLKVERKGNKYNLFIKLIMKKIKSMEKEIKAATYHNLKIEKIADMYKTTIIFDL
ncbi:MAG: archease [Candidatus Omnitrophica bacterium]|nr:archease [Candidatus Omnitrophota bacterium]MCM8809118.1 archease [Candidatus Omnitrophota bacterium]MCM8811097.1 archease [Candidatus Omnitrophota bacterium]MCM8833154.1 archease [Candidatus Omnitrophota bacterium]